MAAIINMQINGVPVTSIGLAGITVAILTYATLGAEMPLGNDGDASAPREDEEGTAAGIVSGLTDMFEGKGDADADAPAAAAEEPAEEQPETRGGKTEAKKGGRRRRTPRGKKRKQRTHKRRIR